MGLVEAQWDMGCQVFCASTSIDASKNAKESNYCLNNERVSDKRTVIANRSRLQHTIGVSQIVWMKQVHKNRVSEVTASNKAEITGADIDACWTKEKGIGLAVLTADCLPIVVTSQSRDWLGVAHAGWKGLAEDVIGELIGCYRSPSSELVAWIGPSISQGKYEVGEDVWPMFDESFSEMTLGVSGGTDKRFLNLIAIAESQLTDAGVTKLFYSGLCSFSDVRFFSARRLQQQGTREYNGRLATVAFLKG